MTDQTIPDVTKDDRRLAREWAEHVESSRATWGDRFRAAARVILNAVPAPPTLADMTEEERRECRWLQCDYGEPGRAPRSRGVIGYFDHEERRAVILTTTCGILRRDYANVTPRPDLPRMEWPGTEKPSPAPALPGGWRLADHPDHGHVIVTNPTPTTDGFVHFMMPDRFDPLGCDWMFCDPDELVYLDQEDDQ